MLVQLHSTNSTSQSTVILEIYVLLIFVCLIFDIIYYLWFQKAVKVCCCKSSLQLNFQVFTFHAFLEQQIINKRENFQNYGSCKLYTLMS